MQIVAHQFRYVKRLRKIHARHGTIGS